MKRKDETVMIQEIKGKGEVLKGLFTDKNQIEEKEVRIEEKKITLGEAGNRGIHTRIRVLTEAGYQLKEEDRKLGSLKEKARDLFERNEKNKEYLSAEMLKRFQEEGIQAGEVEADVIGKSIENILETREEKRENLQRQVEKLEENRESIKRMAISETGDRGVIRKLENSGLPVTKENVEKLTNAMAVAEEAIKNLTEPAMKHLIENKLSETVENLYKAGHSVETTGKLVGAAKEIIWEDVKGSAGELLKSQGVELNAESEEAAKWLFKNDLEVSSDHVAEYLSLKELKAGEEKEEEKEKNALKMTGKMAEGSSPLKAELGNANFFRAKYRVQYFREVVETKEVFQETSARRMIEEIRLKLTEESAMRMLSKGFKIDVNDLKGLVEKLREEEEAQFRSLAAMTEGTDEKVGVKNGQEMSHVELFKATLSIRSYTMGREKDGLYEYGSVFEVYRSQERISISGFYRAGLAYESGATEVRSDLGDSIKKAFSNIDEILEMHGERFTEENRKAVRLLAYNHAEVNKESIFRMKKAVLLSEAVFREMKPATVVSLIQKGENPLDLPMEDLLEKLKEINRVLQPEEEKFSSYLYKLEKAGEVGKEERKAYIGIFRLLSQIEKGDYAAVGSVSLTEKTMNLRNLLSAVRTGKLGGFDKLVREEIGELERSFSENRIDRQIEQAYESLLAGKIKAELAEEREDYFAERIKEWKEGEAEVSDVERLLEEGSKVSLSNTLAQMEIRNGRKSFRAFLSDLPKEEKEEINAETKGMLDGFEEMETIEGKVRNFSKDMVEKIEKKEEETLQEYASYRNLMKLKSVLNLSAHRARREIFDLPIFYDEDKVADLQLTIRSAGTEEERGKIEMKLSFEEREVKAEFRLSQGRVSGIFLMEGREEYEKLKLADEEFKEVIKKAGWLEGEISYHLGKASSQITSFDDIYNSGNKKKNLYALAKQTASHVLRVMGMQER